MLWFLERHGPKGSSPPAPQEPVQSSGQLQQKAETLCESQDAFVTAIWKGTEKTEESLFWGGLPVAWTVKSPRSLSSMYTTDILWSPWAVYCVISGAPLAQTSKDFGLSSA